MERSTYRSCERECGSFPVPIVLQCGTDEVGIGCWAALDRPEKQRNRRVCFSQEAGREGQKGGRRRSFRHPN